MPTTDADHAFAMLMSHPDAYITPIRDPLDDEVGALRMPRRLGRVSRKISRASRGALRAHPLALTHRAARLAAKGVAAATGPIRRRIFRAFFGKLAARRARLLAWNGRRDLRPNAAESAQARDWAVAYVKRRGWFGRLVGTSLSGASIGEPASAALVTASIPVLIEIARRALRTAEREGAPANPREHSGDENNRD